MFEGLSFISISQMCSLCFCCLGPHLNTQLRGRSSFSNYSVNTPLLQLHLSPAICHSHKRLHAITQHRTRQVHGLTKNVCSIDITIDIGAACNEHLMLEWF